MNSRMLNEISITKGVREAHLFDYDASGQISAKIYQNETACFFMLRMNIPYSPSKYVAYLTQQSCGHIARVELASSVC